MSRLLAVEWDSREARVVAATVRPGELRIEQMFCVPLTGDDADAAGAALAAALADRKLTKSPAVVTLARSQVELKALTLPPSPNADLPAMARLQAEREFTSLAADWPLDYLPLSDDETKQREVLAAAVSPEAMQRAGRVCAPPGLEAARYLVRPFAAASRFARTPEGRGCAVALLIDLSPTEADLTVIVEHRVVFTRTARLSGDVLAASDDVRLLVSEIRRTLAAVHSQLGARRVEAVYLLGASSDHQTLCGKLQAELNLPCRTVDPLAGSVISREATAELPEGASSRFAALLGALADEAENATPAIDFLHPRRPPPPARSKRPLVLGAVAAGLLLLLGSVVAFQWWSLGRQIAALQQRGADKDLLTPQITQLKKELEIAEDFHASDVNWLHEMAALSDKLHQQEMVLTKLSLKHDDGAAKALRDTRKKPAAKTAKSKGADKPSAAGQIEFDGLAMNKAKVRDTFRSDDPQRPISVPRNVDVEPAKGKSPSKYKAFFQGVVKLPLRDVMREPVDLPPKEPPSASAVEVAAREGT